MVLRVVRESVAIATTYAVFDRRPVDLSVNCGLLKWCMQATRTAESITNLSGFDAEAVIFTNLPKHISGAVCTSPKRPVLLPLDTGLIDAAHNFVLAVHNRTVTKGSRGLTSKMAFLMKWEALRHTEYAAIIHIDIDVDLLLFWPLSNGPAWSPDGPWRRLHTVPPKKGTWAYASWRYTWGTLLPHFVRAPGEQMVTSHDFATPISAAIMVLKPSNSTYNTGLNVLRTRRWHPQRGFNDSGSPREVVDEEALTRRSSVMNTSNSWKFTGGDADQGLLVHVFMGVLRSVGHRDSDDPWNNGRPPPTCADCLGGSRSAVRRPWLSRWHAKHFWAGDKPWLPGKSCLPYFDFVDDAVADLPMPNGRWPECLRRAVASRDNLIRWMRRSNGTGHFRCRGPWVPIL